jgi:hypothetical protein
MNLPIRVLERVLEAMGSYSAPGAVYSLEMEGRIGFEGPVKLATTLHHLYGRREERIMNNKIKSGGSGGADP